MFGNPFRLRSTLSASTPADKNDLLNAQHAFGSLGYYKPLARKPSILDSNNLFEGIRRFQSDHGLKRDGVMNPGGETERILGKALEKKREHSNPSLLDSLPPTTPGIMPEEHDWNNRKTQDIAFPELPGQTRKPIQDIRKLLELIAKKAQDNEVVTESARTVKAALKTSNHRDLAKLHAQAVRDFEDDALAEIAEFSKQLKKANPKAHESWFKTFSQEVPEEAERMLNTESINDGELNGSSKGNHSQNHSDQTIRGGENAKKHEESDVLIPPFPTNKEEFLAGQEKDWKAQHDAFNNLSKNSETESHVYMEIFGQEGGVKQDQEGTAVGGIRQGTLNDLNNRSKLGGIPANMSPADLSPDQRAQVYRAYFDDVLEPIGGSVALGSIKDPKSASAFGDTLFRDGREGGTVAIQEAILIVKPNIELEVDGRLGEITFDAYKELTSDPTLRKRLLDALADKRTVARPNERSRFDHYRINN